MSNTEFVTAFYDIGRESWKEFSRCTDVYIQRFHNMANRLDNCFVVYTSSELVSKIQRGLEKNNVKIIQKDFKRDFSERIERVTEIQNSEAFSKNISRYSEVVGYDIKQQFPEYHKPLYTALMLSKLDFIQDAIVNNYVTKPYTGWIDFGYIAEDKDFWGKTSYHADWEDNKIRLLQRVRFNQSTVNVKKRMLTNTSPLSGGAYVAKKRAFSEFLNLWNNQLDFYLSRDIVDDDQGFLLACLVKKPELFECINTCGEWRFLLSTGH